MKDSFVCIHQPNFLPWIGIIQRIALADIFVVLDNVQYSKNQFQNRNTILTQNGPLLLTVPISKNGEKSINQVEICNKKNWRKKHLNSIYFSYKNSSQFSSYFELLENIYKQDFDLLIDFNMELLKSILDYLEINTKLEFSSELNVVQGKTSRLVDICENLKSKYYIYGGDSSYIDKAAFLKKEIEPVAQNFVHPVYQQVNSKEFVSKLSVIDWIFNVPKNSITRSLSIQKEQFSIAYKKQRTMVQ